MKIRHHTQIRDPSQDLPCFPFAYLAHPNNHWRNFRLIPFRIYKRTDLWALHSSPLSSRNCRVPTLVEVDQFARLPFFLRWWLAAQAKTVSFQSPTTELIPHIRVQHDRLCWIRVGIFQPGSCTAGEYWYMLDTYIQSLIAEQPTPRDPKLALPFRRP